MEPVKQRAEQGCLHWTKGPHTEWEDALVSAFGASWRDIRDQCKSLKDWLSHLPRFLDVTCRAWSLPLPKAPPILTEPVERPVKKRVVRSLDGLPVGHAHGIPASLCGSGRLHKSFQFIVDCQPLQRAACGYCPLESEEVAVVFERITTNIQSIFKAGWRPPRAWDDSITWHRREHNVVADFLANYTMDRKESWNKICDWPFPGHGLQDCSFVVHSDGGTRWGTCSGSAFIVEADCWARRVGCSNPWR